MRRIASQVCYRLQCHDLVSECQEISNLYMHRQLKTEVSMQYIELNSIAQNMNQAILRRMSSQYLISQYEDKNKKENLYI